MNENAVAQRLQLEAANAGLHLWRNNVGVLIDDTGRPVRYGLANESPAVNKRIKSSDYIGVTPVLITPDLFGRILGVFTAFETKASDWTFKPSDDRAVAQMRFHDIVRGVGGFAGFVSHPDQMYPIIGRKRFT